MARRLFLVRHGETVDNVAGLYAGSRDSSLTNHGVLQARRLATHLASRSDTIGPIQHVFASNLQRAAKTAEAIADEQGRVQGVEAVPSVIQLPELREKDFGSEEGMRFGKRAAGLKAVVASNPADYITPESQEAMTVRVERFLDAYLVPVITEHASTGAVVVVAHGIILNVVLRCLLTRFGPDEFTKLPSTGDAAWRKEWLAAWSNAGYLEAELRVSPPVAVSASSPTYTSLESNLDNGNTVGALDAERPTSVETNTTHLHQKATAPSAKDVTVPAPSLSSSVDVQLSVKRINCVDHLQGLKKTRGGIGSAGFDAKQKTMDSFFSKPAKKPKLDDGSG